MADEPSYGGSVALLVVALAISAIEVLTLAGDTLHQDAWLALLAGRDLLAHGLPHHDTLTIAGRGAPWIDQQWLSQAAMYGIYRAAGPAALVLSHTGLIVAGVGGAMWAARRLGASARAVLFMVPLTLPSVILAVQVRTQAYAYPLFALVLFLLTADSRRPSRRVLWCVPLLVLWANVHGSASLGAALVALRGVTLLWERRSRLGHDARAWLLPGALCLTPLSLLATPYGLANLGYYQRTLFSGAFRHYVTEWQPITYSPVLAGFAAVLLGALLWSWWRRRGLLTLFERLSLLMLAAGAALAVRNLAWFALGAMLIGPIRLGLRSVRAPSPRRVLVDRAVAAAAVAGLLASGGAMLARPRPSFEHDYPSGALAAVQAQARAHPGMRIFADVAFADWLLWHAPDLRGRIAYDARFELLSGPWLARLIDLDQAHGRAFKADARGYRLMVLDPVHAAPMTRAFEAEPGRQILFGNAHALVVLRSASQAA